ncbi:MAG TPA: FAD-dependent oxidoreductase [Kineosporiaceae bacterium]|nr:FAD-dependent oxidoreductase [Kineosporiaceae bacterium]
MDVRTGVQVNGLVRGDESGGYRVLTSAGPVRADAVVLAVPALVAGSVCRSLDPGLSERLAQLPVTSSVSVSLGFRGGDLIGLPARQGFVVPASDGRRMRACVVSSRKYPGRAPEGHVLMRVVLDAAREDELTALDDVELVRIARDELASVLGLRAEPVLARVHRWLESMPSYTVGYLDQVAASREQLDAFPGVTVAGSGYDGAGVPECIAFAHRAVDSVLAAAPTTSGPNR